MVTPVGVDDLRRGAARRRRGLRRAARHPPRRRPRRPARATRAASRRRLPSNEAAVEVILRAIERAGYRPGDDVAIALDPATSSILVEGTGVRRRHRPVPAGARGTDPRLRRAHRPVGALDRRLPDRLARGRPRPRTTGPAGASSTRGSARGSSSSATTSSSRTRAFIARGIAEDAMNSVLIKLNQIGTLTETIDAIELARRAGWTAMVSHRSGETEDTTIADFVVAMGTGQIKTGAPSRSERVAKYNRLLRIEGELGDSAPVSGPGRARCPARRRRPRRARDEGRVPLVSRLVDRGAITAAYVGIGMAVTIVVSFLLFIPIEPFIWLLALPSGLLIGYYANQRSNRRAGPWSRILVNGVFAGRRHRPDRRRPAARDQGAVLLRRRRAIRDPRASAARSHLPDRRRLRLPALPRRPAAAPSSRPRRDRRRRSFTRLLLERAVRDGRHDPVITTLGGLGGARAVRRVPAEAGRDGRRRFEQGRRAGSCAGLRHKRDEAPARPSSRARSVAASAGPRWSVARWGSEQGPPACGATTGRDRPVDGDFRPDAHTRNLRTGPTRRRAGSCRGSRRI